MGLEHADGSFFEHLMFCRDYCIRHYPSQSPTPLFIHSILGTGANFFPMRKEKIPQLAALLTPSDMLHIEVFPAMLRLLACGLVDSLRDGYHAGRLPSLKSVTFHRLIDN